ncbi:MAG: hypothetical protein E7056_06965 [Lentisphaerae bacterium]|nr:hypothetical protein [Lentisphaerota bacterium]
MKFVMRLLFLLMLTGSILPAAENFHLAQAVNKLYVIVPPEAGHQVPVLEFIRRIDRVLRQYGKLDNSAESGELVLRLQKDQSPGSWRFAKSSADGSMELILPTDYRNWVKYPELGRTLITAMIRCRIGGIPYKQLPADGRWIADGLWAEFIHRERSRRQILRFTYLEGLRNLAEAGLDVTLSQQDLAAPVTIRPGAADWVLYCERARLMLEIIRDITPRHSNLLKDYLFLLEDGKLSAAECFEKSFSQAAADNLRRTGNLSPQKLSLQDSFRILTLRTLFSIYAPMAPDALSRRFDMIDQVSYRRQESGKNHLTANLTDLPALVEKYPPCGELPLIKIAELNELAALMPQQLRGDIFKLTATLSAIGKAPAETISNDIRRQIRQIRSKLRELKTVDAILAEYENSLLPPLYRERYKLDNPLPEPPLPPLIKQFFDRFDTKK